MKPKTKIVIIAAGSFQGKSIIANKVAADLGFSGIITTDLIRNILKIKSQNEEKFWGTSTYLLSKSNFIKQTDQVSMVSIELIKIYESRGESIIFEGMHFTRSFLKWAAKKRYCCICLNNLTKFENRIVLKSKTRSLFRFISSVDEFEFDSINKSNVSKSAYIYYSHRINEIHVDILRYCKKYNYNIVEFQKIKEGSDKVRSIVKKYVQ